MRLYKGQRVVMVEEAQGSMVPSCEAVTEAAPSNILSSWI